MKHKKLVKRLSKLPVEMLKTALLKTTGSYLKKNTPLINILLRILMLAGKYPGQLNKGLYFPLL